MARVTNQLVKKLHDVLAARFPAPATIKLEQHKGIDGVYGVVRSDEFASMDGVDRQELMRQLLDAHLTKEEKRQVQIIVAVTHHEGDGYLAGAPNGRRRE